VQNKSQHACKTSAHAQGLYFQTGGCECELHNTNAFFELKSNCISIQIQSRKPEEVGHGLKGIMVGRISESRTLFYRGHEINMACFPEEVSINIGHFYLLLFGFAISNPRDKLELVVG